MNVLVIGGTRFIGPRVVERLAGAGHEVTLFNRGLSSAELPENAGDGMVERLAAEVVRDRFGDGLPDLPRPLLWIEHIPPRRKGPGKYFLLTFPTYTPRSEGAGFVRRFTLGSPSRERLTPSEVEVLTGEEL